MPAASRSISVHWASVRWISLAALATFAPAQAFGQAGAPTPPTTKAPDGTPSAAEQPSVVPARTEAPQVDGAAAPAPSDGAAAPAAAAPAPSDGAAGSTAVDPSTNPNAPVASGPDLAAAATSPDASTLDAAMETPAELGEGEAEEPKINFYGFADAAFSKDFKAESIGNKYSTFAVGSLNLYMASELGSQWRSLVEVRFMYLPHGQVPYNEQFTGGARVDTTAQDYNDVNRPARWGGIGIQRAWIERTFHELFTLRIGQFLSPYGIWNVDHGSPVIIGVRRPYMVGEALIPESQTGLEAYGSFYYKATQFGYHLTLTNGRGPIDTYKDLNHNKAVGGRLFVRTEGDFGRLAFGISGYRGRYSDRTSTFSINPDGSAVTNDPAINDYQELSYATDVKWELEGALVQAEAARNEITYVDARPMSIITGGPAGFTPDWVRQGFYALGGYRIASLWNTMPFIGGEYMHYGQQQIVPAAHSYWVGLNIRPTPRVVLKSQLSKVMFGDAPTGVSIIPTFYKLETQVAWSF